MEPVVVIADGSPWSPEAVEWATAHADLVAAPVVARWADDHFPAQLVVLGHQDRVSSSLGLGKHVLSVVGAAGCDAVVVRGTAAARLGTHRRVTALVSGGPDDAVVLTAAARFARLRGAVLRVLHAVPLPVVRADQDEDRGWVLDRAAELLGGFPHSAVLVRRQPHEAISRCLDTDLIVVGPGETRTCGSVTKAALHHAPCPVLVPHRPDQEDRRDAPSVPAPRRPVRTPA
ncbi:universal stress protein [Lentzea sp. NPDC003310]|uniref:universal stress protein n=1 Tax=Lentzea sp. NPDC003310 TaxID=3154447 RepID=UPI0033ABBE42